MIPVQKPLTETAAFWLESQESIEEVKMEPWFLESKISR